MKSGKTRLLPKEKRILEHLGENIRLARLRRKLTTLQVSERADIGRSTLWHVEKGSGHIGIGIYLQVLLVLGLADDLTRVAEDDVLGRKLQDAKLVVKQRAPKKNTPKV
jgi:transcriptional regulator with XRE-family HTH domain